MFAGISKNTRTILYRHVRTPLIFLYSVIIVVINVFIEMISYSQSEEDSRVLQIAPTIYHQCQALIRILDRYNWTDFSIVTTKVSSGGDFISCMRNMVEKTSITQGFIKKAKSVAKKSVNIFIYCFDSNIW